ncbi:cellulose binding domain-containing protein [Candidatus Woesebacteria bacterium]|nr:cellulose binding domain-containing protein [Candidatus Woesebacteria bacterium]
MYSSWNATFTSGGSSVTAQSLGWNSTLPANGSVSSSGFCANKESGYVAPTVTGVDSP